MAAAIPAPFSLGDALQLTLAQACLLANVFIASYTLRAVHTNLSFAVPGVLLFCASLAWFGNSEAGLGLGGVVLFCLSFFWMRLLATWGQVAGEAHRFSVRALRLVLCVTLSSALLVGWTFLSPAGARTGGHLGGGGDLFCRLRLSSNCVPRARAGAHHDNEGGGG